MLPQNYGHLLFNAVRETLETMAFAEVIPCSIKVGDEEFAQDESDFSIAGTESASEDSGWGQPAQEEAVDSWGTASPKLPEEDSWGTPAAAPPETDDFSGSGDGSWGEPNESEPVSAAGEAGDDWGRESLPVPVEDPWGESDLPVGGIAMKSKEINFDELVENQADWCWACMKVNSPDIHSVWFIISKGLAGELAQNMYAGENIDMNGPLIRDLIAELTNVLGGRLMLLLEEMGGKFTLTVPEIGFGLPQIPESQSLETVLCKVVVDGEFPVIASICFNQSPE